MKKIFLFDFDGTLVTEDILDVVCDIVGKKEESKRINEDVLNGKVTGLKPLCNRINFLKGVTNEQIKEKLDENNYLRPGVIELFEYLNKKGYITVLSSGNIKPVLKYYQGLLNITYIFGTIPNMKENKIIDIDESNFNGHDFKYEACLGIINKYEKIEKKIYGIGDSAVDIKMLSLTDMSFAIEPKGGLDEYVDYVIENISDIIDYIDKEI